MSEPHDDEKTTWQFCNSVTFLGMGDLMWPFKALRLRWLVTSNVWGNSLQRLMAFPCKWGMLVVPICCPSRKTSWKTATWLSSWFQLETSVISAGKAMVNWGKLDPEWPNIRSTSPHHYVTMSSLLCRSSPSKPQTDTRPSPTSEAMENLLVESSLLGDLGKGSQGVLPGQVLKWDLSQLWHNNYLTKRPHFLIQQHTDSWCLQLQVLKYGRYSWDMVTCLY